MAHLIDILDVTFQTIYATIGKCECLNHEKLDIYVLISSHVVTLMEKMAKMIKNISSNLAKTEMEIKAHSKLAQEGDNLGSSSSLSSLQN